MSEKLRMLGAGIKDGSEKKIIESKESIVPLKKMIAPKPNSFAEVVTDIKFKTYDEVVRVKVGEEEIRDRLGKLDCCLVG